MSTAYVVGDVIIVNFGFYNSALERHFGLILEATIYGDQSAYYEVYVPSKSHRARDRMPNVWGVAHNGAIMSINEIYP